MASKAEIENYIVTIVDELGHFEHADPALLNHEGLHMFIEAGYALLEHYQTNADTVVDDAIIGAYVDCTLLMGAFASDGNLPDDRQQQAEELMVTIEDLVNAITAAVEQNINATR
jgi:hypothetical protein